MVEKIIVTPESIRGHGNIIMPKTGADFEEYNCTMEVSEDTINNEDVTVYILTPETTTISLVLSSDVSTVTVGGNVVLSVTVTEDGEPVSGQSVSFNLGSTEIGTGTTNSSGVATYTHTTASSGSLNYSAVYSGHSSNTVSVVCSKRTATATIGVSSSSVTVGTNVTLTGTIKYNNTGINGLAVTFKEGTTTVGTGTTNSSGIATCTVSDLAVGSYSFTATSEETEMYTSATSSSASVTVNKKSSTTSLTLSDSSVLVGTDVTAFATVTASSTGVANVTVTFKDGNTTLGTATTNSNGSASFNITGLSVGSHSITASWDGNDTISSSTSTSKSLTILDHSYSLAFSQSSYAASGGSATLELTLTDNSVPVSGATVSVTGSDSSSYSCITNSSGVGSVTVTDISAETTFTCSYQGVSDTCTVTTGPTILFYDACDSTYKSSEYGTIVKVSSSTTTNYTAYDSTNNCYKTRANGDWGCLPINALNNADNYKITAYFKTPSSNHLYRGGFGLVKSGTTSPFWSFRIQGDNKFVYQKYNVASEVAIATNIDASGYFHRMELIKQGSTITCKLYAQDDTTVLGTKTITDTIDTPVMGLYLCCGSSYGCYVKEIKAEAL